MQNVIGSYGNENWGKGEQPELPAPVVLRVIGLHSPEFLEFASIVCWLFFGHFHNGKQSNFYDF